MHQLFTFHSPLSRLFAPESPRKGKKKWAKRDIKEGLLAKPLNSVRLGFSIDFPSSYKTIRITNTINSNLNNMKNLGISQFLSPGRDGGIFFFFLWRGERKRKSHSFQEK